MCVRLTQDVALVGGGNTGFNISAPGDCHVYLLNGGDELALIDAGVGGVHGDTGMILANIEADDFDPARISRLLLTHYHADHAGGAAELRDRLGCDVHGTELTARTMETGDEIAISLQAAKAAGIYPTDYEFRACPAVGSFRDGQPFRVGRLTVTPFDTPGHCRGHASLLVEGGDRRYLIGGDLVFYGGSILLQNILDCSITEYAESVHRMREVPFDALLPGHFTLSLRDGMRHLRAAAAAFATLAVPKNAL